MNLLQQAEADLGSIIEDADTGMGVAVVLIDTEGTRYGESAELIGKTNDIGFSLDPDTGALFRGRTAEIDLRLSTVLSVTGGIPQKGWKAEVTPVNGEGTTWTFTVTEAPVDRTLGIVKLWLNLVETEE